tara:strand:- start:1979 stop:3130 length:1152 start_codon:yes stop_codon:yes gene_type:complete
MPIEQSGNIETILSILLIALIISIIFRFLKLPVILGYIVSGALLGPKAFGLIKETLIIKELSEFGIVFLMFTIGLEFSLKKLFRLKNAVIILGGSQVLITIIITYICGLIFGMTKSSAFTVGCITAMSSTAIILKELYQNKEHNKKYALNAIGILLFQDIAVIPIIVILPNLNPDNINDISIVYPFFKSILAVTLILIIGRWFLQPLFKIISNTKVLELFTLSTLLVVIGSAWITHSLGFSYTLGALISGIMLSETEFKHNIEIEIRPFKDVLLGLFFISIGMLVDISTWAETWVWIMFLLIAIVIGKSLLITTLSFLNKQGFNNSFKTGLILAQGGEFGFAILSIASQNKLLPTDYSQVVLAALLISFAIAPIIVNYVMNKK